MSVRALVMLMCMYVQLPGVKAKVFSEDYDLKEVGAFWSLSSKFFNWFYLHTCS